MRKMVSRWRATKDLLLFFRAADKGVANKYIIIFLRKTNFIKK